MSQCLADNCPNEGTRDDNYCDSCGRKNALAYIFGVMEILDPARASAIRITDGDAPKPADIADDRAAIVAAHTHLQRIHMRNRVSPNGADEDGEDFVPMSEDELRAAYPNIFDSARMTIGAEF